MIKRLVLMALFLIPTLANAHTASLSWTASVTSGVRYNIYRSISGANSFNQIGSTLALTFNDLSVIAGASYDYKVTAYCLTCPAGTTGESAMTNLVTAQIPGPVPSATVSTSGDVITFTPTNIPSGTPYSGTITINGVIVNFSGTSK